MATICQLHADLRYYLCMEPVDMRKQFQGLQGIVNVSKAESSGNLFTLPRPGNVTESNAGRASDGLCRDVFHRGRLLVETSKKHQKKCKNILPIHSISWGRFLASPYEQARLVSAYRKRRFFIFLHRKKTDKKTCDRATKPQQER